ncbi:MAG: hypothetical protein Q7I97_07410, partial [Thermovirgaceae bacterium]|nr:hypothetical protein [Thermovirgaceae bacterium]
ADTYAAELSRYIHLNPVGAKMVGSPEEYPWSSYRYYADGAGPSWLSTSFVLGYFGRGESERRTNYRNYVHEMEGKEFPSPLTGTVASTILGSESFVRDIREKHLEGKASDRDLPALRELSQRPDIEMIKLAAEDAFQERGKLARMAGLYLCHRYSGAKLKEIGDLYGISESGVTQAGRRFEEAMEKDISLGRKIADIRKKLKLSIV